MASTFPGAIDSFTDPLSGSALNSPSHSAQHADLNDAAEKIETYMGLVKVVPTGATNGTVGATGTVTIGNAVTSLTVSGAFSSLYDNYKIMVDVTTQSAPGASIGMSLNNATGATYLHGGIYMLFGSTTVNGYGPPITTSWTDLMAGGSPSCASIDLHNPFATRPTVALCSSVRGNVSPSYGHYVMNGLETSSNSHTAFTITCISGNMTGGSVRVYGYRN